MTLSVRIRPHPPAGAVGCCPRPRRRLTPAGNPPAPGRTAWGCRRTRSSVRAGTSGGTGSAAATWTAASGSLNPIRSQTLARSASSAPRNLDNYMLPGRPSAAWTPRSRWRSNLGAVGEATRARRRVLATIRHGCHPPCTACPGVCVSKALLPSPTGKLTLRLDVLYGLWALATPSAIAPVRSLRAGFRRPP
jgi:hypothetical protein